jgi:hypothetical protein
MLDEAERFSPAKVSKTSLSRSLDAA